MNKARAYKELQRRQTKRLSELLMTLYAAERAAAAAAGRRLDATDCAAAAATPAVLLVLAGSSGDRGCSRLSGVSHGAASAAVISYVSTQLPRIGGGGGGGGQPSQPPAPPPWAHAPAPGGFRPSTVAAPRCSTTAGLCGAAAPAAEAAAGRGLELPRGTRSAGRLKPRRSVGDGGGSASNSARTPTSGGSSSGSSDPGAAAGEELSSSPDRQAAAAAAAPATAATAPIFPTASQMRQLLSSLVAADSRYDVGKDFSGRTRLLPRSAVRHRLGRRPTDDGNLGPTLALPPQSSTAGEDCTSHPSNGSSISHTIAVESLPIAKSRTAASTSPGQNSSRRSGGGVAKQVSFVDPQPTQVQFVSPPPSPPGSPPSQPPWWWANAEAAARRATAAAAAAIAAASSPAVPVLSEKNLQLHAAAMHAASGAAATNTAAAVAAASAARRKKEPAVGGSEQPSCSLDERTAAWIRERQVPQRAAGKSAAFSDIPEESDSERADLAS